MASVRRGGGSATKGKAVGDSALSQAEQGAIRSPAAAATAAYAGPGSGTNSANRSPVRSAAASPRGGTAGRNGGGAGSGEFGGALQNVTSFRHIVRQRLLNDVILSTAGDDKWRVMVLDPRATRVVSSLVGMYDIMEAHVTVVEDLHKARQPFQEMEAVYVLSPSADSVERLKRDFASKKEALYGSVHLFFLERVPDDVMASLKQAPLLVSRIKSFKEINLDFLAPEDFCYHLDTGHTDTGATLYRQLYSPNRGFMSTDICRKLVTVCATINEFPHVRFHAESPHAEMLARDFQTQMNEFIAHSPSWSFHGQDDRSERGRSTLILIDRNEDPLSPFMHEFTYQCLVHDLLPVEEDRISYQAETGAGAAKKEVLLNDKDDLWVEFRHDHIGLVLNDLGDRFKGLVKDNSGAAALVKGQGRQMSVEEMARATRDLPEFQELTKKMSQHIHLAQQCMQKVAQQNLLKIGALEQSMALGTDEAGKKRSRRDYLNGWTVDDDDQPGLLEILGTPSTSQEIKLRLLAIFVISQKGITAQEREALYSAAGLGAQHQKVLDALGRLGVNTGEPLGEGAKKKGFFNMRWGAGAKEIADESEYTHMRYTTGLKHTISRLIGEELTIDEYPSVLPMPERAAARKEQPKSIRKGAREQGRAAGGLTGARVIVFVVGGVTYSELRAMHELMRQHGREIVIGSTSFLTPRGFIENLQGLT